MAERHRLPHLSRELDSQNVTREVFTPESPKNDWIQEKWEKVVEIIKRFSHQQFEYMPRVATVGELVQIILAQNDHLSASNGEISLKDNPKQYLVGISEKAPNRLVRTIIPEELSLTISLQNGKESKFEKLPKDIEIRFTMTPRDPAPSQPS